jgi:hypothetical protein
MITQLQLTNIIIIILVQIINNKQKSTVHKNNNNLLFVHWCEFCEIPYYIGFNKHYM